MPITALKRRLPLSVPQVRLPGQATVVSLCRRVSRLFVLLSLLGLGAAGTLLATNPGSEVSVMGAATPTDSLGAIGLTYDGWAGLGLLVAQGLAVIASSLAAWRGQGRVRKIGLAGLLGWSGLWLANGLWLAGASDQFMRVAASWILTGVFAATAVRVLADWPRRARPAEPAPVAPAKPDLVAA